MRRILVWTLAAMLSTGASVAVSGCKIKKRKKHKKYKKYKKHKKKATRTTLKDFLGDSSDVYFAGAPVRVGFSRGQAKNLVGKKGKRQFKTPQGNIQVKVIYGPVGRVFEVKANFDMGLSAVLPLARAKWGPPARVVAGRYKWVKSGVRVILKVKEGQVKIGIRREAKGGTAARAAPPGARVKLADLLGDKKEVYLKGVPLKLGQPKSEGDKVVGPTGKKRLVTDHGGGLIKISYTPDNKVDEIKIKLDAKLDVVMPLAEAKWGKPKKKDAERTKWVKGKVKIILKVKNNQVVIAILEETRGGPALKKEL